MPKASDTTDDAAPPAERYHFKPLRGSSHYWALSHLRASVQGQRVLDIGPGGGAIGEQLSGCSLKELVGVEVDAESRARLPGVYTEVFETISPLHGRKFDTVLLLDVLEHMGDPFNFMKNLEQLLAPNARIFISVPNVAHWTVRLSLLVGRFNYTSRGILDRTHLQFFTRRRFLSLCESVKSLRFEELSASTEPVEILLPSTIANTLLFSLLARARLVAANALPGLLAYQHLAILRYHS